MAGGIGRPLRAVVVGCGAIAEEHLPFLAASELVELVAVCDLSPALAELARDRYHAGVASTDARTTLAELRPDVVHVLSPPRTHPPLIRRALECGAHVICEKPLAPTAHEVCELLHAAREAGRHVVETRNVLYNDVVIALDRAIADGRVGEVREVDVSLALDLAGADVPPGGIGLPGGIAHDYLPHLAYLLLHVAGAARAPDDVTGTIDNLSGLTDLGYDHVDALMTLGAVRARVRVSPDVQPAGMRVAVRGTTGSLEADVYQPYLRHEGPPWVGKLSPIDLVVQGAALMRAGGTNLRHRLLQHGTYHGMPRMLDALYRALSAGGPLPIREQDLLASAQLIDRIVALGGASR